jgi:transcriptional regulator with XRE-family HTH domain
VPRTSPPLPLPAQRALRKLGSDIRDARRRRRINTTVMADRIQVSRPTLARLERGDAAVGIGAYATALYILGLVDRLGELAALANDRLGQELAREELPQRIRSP